MTADKKEAAIPHLRAQPGRHSESLQAQTQGNYLPGEKIMNGFLKWWKSIGKTTLRAVPALLAAVAFALTTAWAADALKGAAPFYDWQGLGPKDVSAAQKIGWAFFLGLLAVLSVVLLYKTRRSWMPVRSLGRYVGNPRKVLVMCLSTPDPRHKGFVLDSGQKINLHCEEITAKASVEHFLIGSILDDTKATSPIGESKANWQQNLRAVNFHSSTLKHLVVVPSLSKPNDRGSEDYVAPFMALLAHYQSKPDWPNKFAVTMCPPVDYEDFEKLHTAFMGILNSAKGEGFEESEIVFDITAGQKVPSVAAAIVTLTTRADFQYVQTFRERGREPEIITYAVVAESPPSM